MVLLMQIRLMLMSKLLNGGEGGVKQLLAKFCQDYSGRCLFHFEQLVHFHFTTSCFLFNMQLFALLVRLSNRLLMCPVDAFDGKYLLFVKSFNISKTCKLTTPLG